MLKSAVIAAVPAPPAVRAPVNPPATPALGRAATKLARATSAATMPGRVAAGGAVWATAAAVALAAEVAPAGAAPAPSGR